MSTTPLFVQRTLAKLGIAQNTPVRSMTRRDFYDLAAHCRVYASELARYDQMRVNLKECYRFNQWLPGVKAYDLLNPSLMTLKPARPVSRWQILTIAVVAILLFALIAGRYVSQSTATMMLYGFSLSLLLFTFFVPERLYGTTIELLEGKVLRVVEAMEHVLQSEDLGFTEAAYFHVKEDLAAARRELRQQIDLAHRRWR